jgi:hypothetical protein
MPINDIENKPLSDGNQGGNNRNRCEKKPSREASLFNERGTFNTDAEVGADPR